MGGTACGQCPTWVDILHAGTCRVVCLYGMHDANKQTHRQKQSLRQKDSRASAVISQSTDPFWLSSTSATVYSEVFSIISLQDAPHTLLPRHKHTYFIMPVVCWFPFDCCTASFLLSRYLQLNAKQCMLIRSCLLMSSFLFL